MLIFYLMANTRAHIIIEGLVQGIYFRANTKEQAERRGVCGWVKNLPNGAVEAVFEGEEESVNKIIEWCRHGPPGAAVKNISIDWHDYKAEFMNFTVIRGGL